MSRFTAGTPQMTASTARRYTVRFFNSSGVKVFVCAVASWAKSTRTVMKADTNFLIENSFKQAAFESSRGARKGVLPSSSPASVVRTLSSPRFRVLARLW